MEELLHKINLWRIKQDDEQAEQLFRELSDTLQRQAFIIRRLRADLQMTTNYLDTTIHELEQQNIIIQQEADHRFRNIFESTLDGIMLYDYIKHEVIALNAAFFQMFSLTAASFPWGDTLQLFPLYQPTGILTADLIVEVRTKMLKAGKARKFSLFCRRIDGEVFETEAVLGPYGAAEHQVFLELRDISEQRKFELALSQQKEELERYITSNMELENFAYIASHDLQAPIRGIISFTNLLNRQLKDRLGEKEKEYLGFIINNAMSMSKLIKALLTYSRINTQEVNFQALDVNGLLDNLLYELHPILTDKQAKVHYRDLPIRMRADAIKVRQLFQNLISNGLKFVPTDRKPVIEIKCIEQADYYFFSVKDNGIGLSEEFKEQIFLIFKRLHHSEQYEGTGIGLAICKKVVLQHQGQIWVESKEGEGSTFFFTISKQL